MTTAQRAQQARFRITYKATGPHGGKFESAPLTAKQAFDMLKSLRADPTVYDIKPPEIITDSLDKMTEEKK